MSRSYFDKLAKNLTLAELFDLVGISNTDENRLKQITVEGEEDVFVDEVLDIKIGAVHVTAKSLDGRLVSLWTNGDDNSKVYATVVSPDYAKN